MMSIGSLAFMPMVVLMLMMTLFVASPAHAQGLPMNTVAIVNGVSIPQSALTEAMRASGQPDSPQLRARLKEELITRELLYQSAEKAGYGRRADVVRAKVNAEVNAYLADHASAPLRVTDAQVRARYDASVASLGQEEYRISLIAVPDGASAQQVMSALQAGQPFDALARRYSTASSAAQGGALRWMSFPVPVREGHTQGLPLMVAQTVAQLPAGAVAPQPVLVGNSLVIVKLDAKRPMSVPSYEMAQASIRAQLESEAQQPAAQLERVLRNNATIRE
jgi:parvulin-like peptidyl-prolyl isomerase